MRKLQRLIFPPDMICKSCETVYSPKSVFAPYSLKFKCKMCDGDLELSEKAWFGTRDTVLFKFMHRIMAPSMAFLSMILAFLTRILVENVFIRFFVILLVVTAVFFVTGFALARIRKGFAPRRL